MPAILTRMTALIILMSKGKLDKLSKASDNGEDYTMLSEAVLRAAAKVTINEDFTFGWEEFEKVADAFCCGTNSE